MKKKIVSKVFAILLAACTVLSACGNESGNQSVGQTDKSETNVKSNIRFDKPWRLYEKTGTYFVYGNACFLLCRCRIRNHTTCHAGSISPSGLPNSRVL